MTARRRGEVRVLLEAHQPVDAAETRARDEMLALLGVAGDPFSARHFEPGHFTGSSFVVSPDRSSLLLVHHRKLGFWVQPGGHIDPEDMSPLAAAEREAVEEAGPGPLEHEGGGLFDVDVHRVPGHRDQPAHLHFDLRFLFRATTSDLRPGDEVAGARWVLLGDVESEAGEADLSRVARKLTA